ncbi:MAG: RraA family protein [Nevskiaceae bacterium]|nr:MAG: RraA family protein [Nevskiaceae bacterium]TBR74103.1 MAG: RraA family protein [Nevskiaceae bacterium]
MSFATTDLCDAHPEVQVCEPLFADYGGTLAFHGPIVTLKLFEDNAQVRKTLETAGQGRVLVVDGGGSLRCALVGGNLGALAEKNGWAGVVVNGAIRDSEELVAQDIGVKALGTCPRKSEKGLHTAHIDRAVRFAGVEFTPGAWLYADADGMIVAATAIHG